MSVEMQTTPEILQAIEVTAIPAIVLTQEEKDEYLKANHVTKCPCGSVISKSQAKKHENTKKHQKYLGVEFEEVKKNECECGATIVESRMEAHLKTKRHQKQLDRSHIVPIEKNVVSIEEEFTVFLKKWRVQINDLKITEFGEHNRTLYQVLEMYLSEKNLNPNMMVGNNTLMMQIGKYSSVIEEMFQDLYESNFESDSHWTLTGDDLSDFENRGFRYIALFDLLIANGAERDATRQIRGKDTTFLYEITHPYVLKKYIECGMDVNQQHSKFSIIGIMMTFSKFIPDYRIELLQLVLPNLDLDAKYRTIGTQTVRNALKKMMSEEYDEIRRAELCAITDGHLEKEVTTPVETPSMEVESL